MRSHRDTVKCRARSVAHLLLLIACLMLPACDGTDSDDGAVRATDGSSGDSGSPNVDKFVGNWLYTGESSSTCQGITQTVPDTGEFSIIRGTTSDLVLSYAACDVRFDVSGDIAVIQAGQSCTTTNLQGTTRTVSLTSYTLTTSDGRTGTAQGAGEISESGQTATCTFTETYELLKR